VVLGVDDGVFLQPAHAAEQELCVAAHRLRAAGDVGVEALDRISAARYCRRRPRSLAARRRQERPARLLDQTIDALVKGIGQLQREPLPESA
jgi:hypothetical protein